MKIRQPNENQSYITKHDLVLYKETVFMNTSRLLARQIEKTGNIIKQLLPVTQSSDKLELSEIGKYTDFMENIKAIKLVHQIPFYSRKDGRIFTKVKEDGKTKQIIASSETELNIKLYDFYFGDNCLSLEGFYPKWLEWRDKECTITKKTIKENKILWNTFLGGTEIINIPLKKLKPQHFIDYFRIITKNRKITRKRFNDVKSILNGIIYRAIEKELILHNHLNDIDYRNFKYKAEYNGKLPYTKDERNRIVSNLDNSLYSLAIKFDFYMILRISELRALKWDDISDDYLYIHSYMNEKNVIIEDVKGHQAEGRRSIPITEECKKILSEIKRINPESEYLFIRDGIPLVTVTFNRHIKKCCSELGIEYRSSHQIRFSVASILYQDGVKDTELQIMLGHTTLAMTQHYLKNLIPISETRDKMTSTLG